MGPSVCSGDGFSENWLKGMIDGYKKEIPRMNISFVDVRECSIAHLKAAQVADATGKRFILSGHDVWIKEVAAVLSARFPDLKIPKDLAPGEDKDPGFGVDNTRSRTVLGVEYRSLSDTMGDHAQSLLDRGIVKAE